MHTDGRKGGREERVGERKRESEWKDRRVADRHLPALLLGSLAGDSLVWHAFLWPA